MQKEHSSFAKFVKESVLLGIAHKSTIQFSSPYFDENLYEVLSKEGTATQEIPMKNIFASKSINHVSSSMSNASSTTETVELNKSDTAAELTQKIITCSTKFSVQSKDSALFVRLAESQFSF